MTQTEIREFKVDLLDSIHELASEPVQDLEAIRAMVEDFFKRLEVEVGEKGS